MGFGWSGTSPNGNKIHRLSKGRTQYDPGGKRDNDTNMVSQVWSYVVRLPNNRDRVDFQKQGVYVGRLTKPGRLRVKGSKEATYLSSLFSHKLI